MADAVRTGLGGTGEVPQLPNIALTSSTAKRTVHVVAKGIREIAEGEVKKAELGKRDIRFTVADATGSKHWRIGVKVSDLATLLGVSRRELQVHTSAGSFDMVYGKKLQASLLAKTEAETARFTGLSPEVREKILPQLADFGLTETDLNNIERFYAGSKSIEAATDSKFFSKNLYSSRNIARSLIYIPDGPEKGLYISMKRHEGVQELGRGGMNVVTYLLHVDTGELGAFRAGKADDFNPNEREAVKLLSPFPEHFVVGRLVDYRGPWRDRGDIPAEREESVEKTGCVMQLMGPDLFDYLNPKDRISTLREILDALPAGDPKRKPLEHKLKVLENLPPLTPEKSVEIMHKVAVALQKMHELPLEEGEVGLVHRDLKLENIMVTETGEPRLADFGFTERTGIPLDRLQGTLGFIGPEVYQALCVEQAPYRADPKGDIWSFGGILADLFHGTAWYNWVMAEGINTTEKKYALLYPKEVDAKKQELFPHWQDPNHIHNLIYRCLDSDPEKRPTAAEIVSFLAKKPAIPARKM